MSSGKWLPFCLGLKVFLHSDIYIDLVTKYNLPMAVLVTNAGSLLSTISIIVLWCGRWDPCQYSAPSASPICIHTHMVIAANGARPSADPVLAKLEMFSSVFFGHYWFQAIFVNQVTFFNKAEEISWIITLVRHKKDRFDSKMHGSTQKYPVDTKMPSLACNSWHCHYRTSPLILWEIFFSNFVQIFCF